MKTISIANQKGGVGKTTTANELIYFLKAKGYKVLAIDYEPQANLSLINGLNTSYLYDVLSGKKSPLEAIETVNNIDFIGADTRLYNVESVLNGNDGAIKDLITEIKKTKKYDYVVIDTPPALSNATLTSFVASDYVIVPTTADLLGIKAIIEIGKTIDLVKKFNKKLSVLGVLLTRYAGRRTLSKQLLETVTETAITSLKTDVIGTIRESASIGKAQIMQVSLIESAPKEKATEDYINFFERIGL